MGSMLFVAVFIALQCATGLANPEAKRLYDDLLSNYNRLIRPVGNNSDRLTVKMGLRLSQLIDVVSIFDKFIALSELNIPAVYTSTHMLYAKFIIITTNDNDKFNAAMAQKCISSAIRTVQQLCRMYHLINVTDSMLNFWPTTRASGLSSRAYTNCSCQTWSINKLCKV